MLIRGLGFYLNTFCEFGGFMVLGLFILSEQIYAELTILFRLKTNHKITFHLAQFLSHIDLFYLTPTLTHTRTLEYTHTL